MIRTRYRDPFSLPTRHTDFSDIYNVAPFLNPLRIDKQFLPKLSQVSKRQDIKRIYRARQKMLDADIQAEVDRQRWWYNDPDVKAYYDKFNNKSELYHYIAPVEYIKRYRTILMAPLVKNAVAHSAETERTKAENKIDTLKRRLEQGVEQQERLKARKDKEQYMNKDARPEDVLPTQKKKGIFRRLFDKVFNRDNDNLVWDKKNNKFITKYEAALYDIDVASDDDYIDMSKPTFKLYELDLSREQRKKRNERLYGKPPKHEKDIQREEQIERSNQGRKQRRQSRKLKDIQTHYIPSLKALVTTAQDSDLNRHVVDLTYATSADDTKGLDLKDEYYEDDIIDLEEREERRARTDPLRRLFEHTKDSEMDVDIPSITERGIKNKAYQNKFDEQMKVLKWWQKIFIPKPLLKKTLSKEQKEAFDLIDDKYNRGEQGMPSSSQDNDDWEVNLDNYDDYEDENWDDDDWTRD